MDEGDLDAAVAENLGEVGDLARLLKAETAISGPGELQGQDVGLRRRQGEGAATFGPLRPVRGEGEIGRECGGSEGRAQKPSP